MGSWTMRLELPAAGNFLYPQYHISAVHRSATQMQHCSFPHRLTDRLTERLNDWLTGRLVRFPARFRWSTVSLIYPID